MFPSTLSCEQPLDIWAVCLAQLVRLFLFLFVCLFVCLFESEFLKVLVLVTSNQRVAGLHLPTEQLESRSGL